MPRGWYRIHWLEAIVEKAKVAQEKNELKMQKISLVSITSF